MQPTAFMEFVHMLPLTAEQQTRLQALAEVCPPVQLAAMHDRLMELAAPLEKNEAGQAGLLQRGSLMLDQILNDIPTN